MVWCTLYYLSLIALIFVSLRFSFALTSRYFILLTFLRRWFGCFSYFVVNSTRRFILSRLAFCPCVFSPFSIARTSLWEEKTGLCVLVRLFVLLFITKTYLYNFDPLKPHFYLVKLGFTGVYIIYLISAQKHRLWVLVRTASTRRF